MADTTTTNIGLTKPGVADAGGLNLWGGKINADLDALDAIFASAGTGTGVGLKAAATQVWNAIAGTLKAAAARFLIVDATDNTKVMQFDVSGLVTATTRTVKSPAADGTIQTAEALPSTDTGNKQVFLNAAVALGTVSTFFSGPTTGSIGLAGQKWRIRAHLQLVDPVGAATFSERIWDGTTVYATGSVSGFAANGTTTDELEAYVTLTGPTTFTVQAQNNTRAAGSILASDGFSGATNKATWIIAERLT